MLALCTSVQAGDGTIVDIAAVQGKIQQRFEEFSRKGFRTLGIAYKKMGSVSRISKDHETGMTFSRFLVLFDPPKPRIMETITGLKNLGVALKIITGDNRLVAVSLSQQMGLSEIVKEEGLALNSGSAMADGCRRPQHERPQP